MGGTTSVTVRKPNGEDIRMTRWTNTMSWGICNNKMFESDEKHIDDYLDEWVSMQKDYEANKKTGNYEFPMTDCYFPGEGLVPCGYGLTVVDHVNKIILDMQGYCSFDNIHAAAVSLSLGRNQDEPDSEYSRFKEFFDAGKVKGVKTIETYKAGRELDPLDMTFDETIDALGKDFTRYFDFPLDISPWTIERFDESNSLDTCRMHLRVKELGFELSDEEEEAWSALVREQKEEEDWEEGDEG